VRAEPVEVPKWVRGRESLEMTAPRSLALPVLGLGGSVGTPPEGIAAPLVVVSNEEELNALGEGAAGKIVLFNHAMPPFDAVRGTGYGSAVRFRVHGARWAQARGALAALVRSVTARSLRSPHTGAMSYADARAKIPTAAIAIEDAEMLARLQQRGVPVTLRLRMEARDEGTAPSANVIGEIVGREKPDELVVIGGHIDSWDVGQGAHDDGAGCVITMEALHVLRRLELRPRRTIRVVLWTNEENGLAGGKAYANAHAAGPGRHVAALECDSGCFAPRGFNVGHEDPKREAAALARMRDIVTLLEPLGAAKTGTGGGGADIGPLGKQGVTLIGHEVDSSTYFDYHHTHADTLDKVNPEHLRQNIAAVAVLAYVLAEMPERLDATGE
jgi:Zn-dependent M28 family amino/carboxypeptidase